ncbi:contractile injection system tape measure protein [Aquabacterium sp. OR-4]|uniref:contractile injection system tape measure protein n=1 Tax=Aquabacterium sp. OR-4 TaxID=2978127 RepID=UPI0021B4BA83|nr:contractile injection system tape measure protein [Aquabacterium sp. OR-4]MDT7836283.1 contractile injection system tape measure protein [Aquabacterium sp. OR-4]
MSRHRILRQVIELQGCPPGTDAPLRAHLGDMARRHLLPVIERACAALDGPGALWRTEQLVLDLGAVPLSGAQARGVDDDWAQALALRLEDRLRPALAATLQATDPHQADRELLAQFIDSGSVPWWADLAASGLVAEALQRVLEHARAAQALRDLGLAGGGAAAGAAAAAWQRLLASATPAQRAAWLDALLPPGAGALWRAWHRALADAGRHCGAAAGPLGSAWWALMLPLAARGRAPDGRVDHAAGAGRGRRGGWPDAAALAALVDALAAAAALPAQTLRAAWRRSFDLQLAQPLAAQGGGGAAAGPGADASAWWQALVDAGLHGRPAAAGAAGAAAPAGDPTTRHAADGAPAELLRWAGALPAGAAAAQLLQVLHQHWADWPLPMRQAAATGLRRQPAGAAAAAALAGLDDAGWRALAELALQALGQGRLPASWRDRLAWAARRAAATAAQPSPASAVATVSASEAASGAALDAATLGRLGAALRSAEARASPAPAAGAIDRRFASSEQLAVLDAGLVLLWPFLPAFMARLDLLQTEGPQAGRQFRSPAHAAGAALLLHGLARAGAARRAAAPAPAGAQGLVVVARPGRADKADGDDGDGDGDGDHDGVDGVDGADGEAQSALPNTPEVGDDAEAVAPEHLLPLAKLLCGLSPEAPLPATAGLGAAALAEGDLLLQAAIAQAPILRAITVPAFCASFLWRPGHLGVRDDHWLLRVERAPYDMVRDRFPWCVAQVRLPWMPALLAVEW